MPQIVIASAISCLVALAVLFIAAMLLDLTI
jgi:hypothetical protein